MPACGERHGRAKLADWQILEIRRLYDRGDPLWVIAESFGCTRQNVWLIGRRLRWAHLPEEQRG